MEVPNRALAVAEAGEIILAEIEKTMKNTNASLNEIAIALVPAYGINWGPEVMRKCGNEGRSGLKRINDLLYLVRNSKASPAIYNRMALLWTNAFAILDEFPRKLDEWRALLEKFQLGESPDLKYWVPAIVHCQNRGWEDPGDLASLPIEFTLSGGAGDSAAKPLSRL